MDVSIRGGRHRIAGWAHSTALPTRRSQLTCRIRPLLCVLFSKFQLGHHPPLSFHRSTTMSIRVQPGPPGSLGMSHYGIGGTSPPHASASPPAPGFGGGYPQQYTYNQGYQPQQQMQYAQPYPQQQQQQQQHGYAPGQPQQPYQYGSPQQPYNGQQYQQSPQQPVMVRPAPQQATYNGSASLPPPASSPIPVVSPPSSGPAGAPRVAFTDPAASPPKAPAKHISGATVVATWAHPSLVKGESHTGGVIQSDTKLMARMKVLEDLAPDSKITRFLLNSFALMVDMFKLAMASMLAVFVPQLCPANEEATGGPSNCTNIIVPHDCTFEENFRCLSRFNQFVLSVPRYRTCEAVCILLCEAFCCDGRAADIVLTRSLFTVAGISSACSRSCCTTVSSGSARRS
jgi:hypothetical protein